MDAIAAWVIPLGTALFSAAAITLSLLSFMKQNNRALAQSIGDELARCRDECKALTRRVAELERERVLLLERLSNRANT